MDSLINGFTVATHQSRNLTITKSHTGNFTQSQIGATYTITVTNNGTAPTVGSVTVADTLPMVLSATRDQWNGLVLYASHAHMCA